MKKFFLLCIGLLVAINHGVYAYDYDFYSGGIYYKINNDVVIVKKGESGYQGDIVIPSNVTFNGRNYRVTSIGNGAFENCAKLTSVTIPNSIISIDSYAFLGCHNLSSITIPNSVNYIGAQTFSYCTSLSSVVIPPSVNSINHSAFLGCSNLRSVTISDSVIEFNTNVFSETAWYDNQPDGLVYIGKYVYKYKGEMPAKTNITIKEGTIGIAGDAFYNCSGLSSIAIPNSVTNIGENAFYGCSSLSSIVIPNNVISIGDQAFIGTAWYDNQPNGLVYAGKVAYKYKGKMPAYTSIIINDGTISISGSAFAYCDGLVSVYIPNSVKSIRGPFAFLGCNNLNSIGSGIVKPFAISSYTFSDDTYNVVELIVPKGTKALYQATEGWSQFRKITESANSSVGSEFTKNNINYVVTFSNTVAVRSADNTLQSVIIPESVSYNGTTYRVTEIGQEAFRNCYNLKSVTIPNSVTSIGKWAFRNCGSLTSFTIPTGVKTIGTEAFVDCSGLASITIPSSITSIGDYIFNGCASLTSIMVDSGNKIFDSRNNCNAIIETSSNTLLAGCKNSVIPNNVMSIGTGAFVRCRDLTTITIPNSVTSIGTYAFWSCYSLATITFPVSVKSIGSKAFMYCYNLKTVTSEIQQPFAIEEDVFSTYSTTTLKVPAGTKLAYQSTAGWYQFKNITDGQDVVLTANSYTREYGDPNPAFDYTREGDELIGTPSVTCDATATSPVGKYTIRITKGSVTNSNVSYIDGTLTITKAPLSITAKSYSREEGQENPNFEVTYDGFKNGENESALTIKPTVATTATANSSPGTYDINVSGAEAQNYSISYNKGVLTVTEKDEVAFTIDGTNYLGNKSAKTVVVKSVDNGLVSVEIPASVNYDGTAYQVTGIDNDVFKGSSMAALIWDVEAVLPNNAFSNASIGSNFLLYVKSSSYAPSSVKNVVVDGTAKTIVLSDDGGQFYCPQAFTARSISYTHNYSMETDIGKAKGWETLALPFDVHKISHSTRGEIVPFPSYNSSSTQKPFWLANFSGSGFRRTAAVLANEPYIIAMPNSSSYRNEYNLAGDVTFSADNVQVPKTPSFSGTFVPAFATVAKSSSVYALNVNNRNVKYSGSYDAGSRFIANLRDVRPFEAYISNSSTRGIIEIQFDDGTTDMLDILLPTDESQEVTIHTLSGQQVSRTTQRDFEAIWQQLPKGVYIINGKKWIK